VLLGADDEKRIAAGARPVAEVARHPVVRVRHVAVRPVGLRLEHAVDEQPHPAVAAPPLHRDVVPGVVEHVRGAADRPVAGAVARDAEDEPTACDRHAEFPVLVETIAVDHDVAEHPRRVRPAEDGRGEVLRGAPAQPELDREVGRPDVDRGTGKRGGRIVDADLDPVDVAEAVAVEAQRAGGGCGRQGGGEHRCAREQRGFRGEWSTGS
jgi:hypothetical protein